MFARPTWKTKELRLALGAAVAATTCLAGPWPEVIDLDVGEFCEVPTRKGPVRVMLLGVSEKTEPDYFIPANPRRTTIVGAEAELAVGDQRARVIGRPYQFPVVINGVRIYLESTRFWAQAAVAPLADLKKAVRVSVLDAAEPWGPQDLVFPIENYRWRSASYNNTWGSLVPGNLLYYHRGEDLGAIPDRLPVVAIFGGTVVRTPLTHGKPVGSNHVAIESEDRVVALYSHINYEHLAPELVPGATIKAGQVIGRTGSTWNGGRNQRSDPHLHVGLHRPLGELPDALFPARSSGYPMLVDAYFRKYPDAVLAIAGGCRFAVPGDLIELDATR
ncbi:MAG: M23 family metallopeptidase, partial [Opitutaceae bacterium]